MIGPGSASICSVSESYLDTWSRMSTVQSHWVGTTPGGGGRYHSGNGPDPQNSPVIHKREKQGGQARRVGNRVRLASGIPARVSHSARGRCATKITDAVVWRLGTRHDHVPLNEPCSSTVETRLHRARPPDSANETVRRAVEPHLWLFDPPSSSWLWARTHGRADARTTPSPTCPCEASSSRENSVDSRLPRISALEWHPSQRLTTPPHAGIASGTRRVLDDHPFPRRYARCCLDNTCVLGRHQGHLLIIDVPSGVGEFRHRPSPPVVPDIDLPALDQTSRRGRNALMTLLQMRLFSGMASFPPLLNTIARYQLNMTAEDRGDDQTSVY